MIQPVTKEIATSFGFDEEKGALVASVTEDSPAARAELQPGDVFPLAANRSRTFAP